MKRVGIGFDVHRFVEGRPLILGGVNIPFEKGLEGHSDADVLTHTIADAILGAAGLGDIGVHFPDSEPQWKDVSSLIILEKIIEMLQEKSLAVVNVDAVLIAERPKISPWVPAIRDKLCQTIGVSAEMISIKATTTEGLGFIGEGKGIAAQAVALVSDVKEKNFAKV